MPAQKLERRRYKKKFPWAGDKKYFSEAQRAQRPWERRGGGNDGGAPPAPDLGTPYVDEPLVLRTPSVDPPLSIGTQTDLNEVGRRLVETTTQGQQARPFTRDFSQNVRAFVPRDPRWVAAEERVRELEAAAQQAESGPSNDPGYDEEPVFTTTTDTQTDPVGVLDQDQQAALLDQMREMRNQSVYRGREQGAQDMHAQAQEYIAERERQHQEEVAAAGARPPSNTVETNTEPTAVPGVPRRGGHHNPIRNGSAVPIDDTVSQVRRDTMDDIRRRQHDSRMERQQQLRREFQEADARQREHNLGSNQRGRPIAPLLNRERERSPMPRAQSPPVAPPPHHHRRRRETADERLIRENAAGIHMENSRGKTGVNAPNSSTRGGA